MHIAGRTIGANAPCYIVAEMSANHLGRFDRAVEIVKAASRAGADAIKIQTYTADTLTIDGPGESFRIPEGSIWAGRSLYRLYQEASMSWEWQPDLQRISKELGLDFFSSPFDATAVDFLESLHVPVYKVASFEIVDVPLLQRIAKTRKPVILSTGMASMPEIEEAVGILRAADCEIALLKCTSAYPASPGDMNLRTIPHLAATFDAVAGLSDHTLGAAVPVAAVAVGAKIIEKHLTLSRQDGGADAPFSLEPDEFAHMIAEVRMAEAALGTISYSRTAEENNNLCFRRSLFVVDDVKVGERFTDRNVRSIRPGHGLPPRFLDDIMGRRAACNIARGTPLSWHLIDGGAED
jgi:pseudaminic acid synthase